jgi:hypothetical protein
MSYSDPDATRVLTAITELRRARLRFHEAPHGSPESDAAALEIEWRLTEVRRATRALDRSSGDGVQAASPGHRAESGGSGGRGVRGA